MFQIFVVLFIAFRLFRLLFLNIFEYLYIHVFVVSQNFKIAKFYFTLQFAFCLQLIIVSAPCYNLHHCLGYYVHLYYSHHSLISLHLLKYSFIEIINMIIPSC